MGGSQVFFGPAVIAPPVVGDRAEDGHSVGRAREIDGRLRADPVPATPTDNHDRLGELIDGQERPADLDQFESVIF